MGAVGPVDLLPDLEAFVGQDPAQSGPVGSGALDPDREDRPVLGDVVGDFQVSRSDGQELPVRQMLVVLGDQGDMVGIDPRDDLNGLVSHDGTGSSDSRSSSGLAFAKWADKTVMGILVELISHVRLANAPDAGSPDRRANHAKDNPEGRHSRCASRRPAAYYHHRQDARLG